MPGWRSGQCKVKMAVLSQFTYYWTVDQYNFDNFADCKPPRLKVNYMLEDLKPLVHGSSSWAIQIEFCLPQSDKVGTPMKCVLGASIECV